MLDTKENFKTGSREKFFLKTEKRVAIIQRQGMSRNGVEKAINP